MSSERFRSGGSVVSDLTPSEQSAVRVALRFLKTRAGGWEALARVLHFGPSTLGNVASERTRKTPTASMALRIARLAQVTVDDVLAGAVSRLERLRTLRGEEGERGVRLPANSLACPPFQAVGGIGGQSR